MKKKASLLLAIMLVFALLMSGCGAKSSPAEATGDKNAVKPLKVALILPGKVDDVSWNQAMHEGMKELEKDYAGKIEVTYSENVYEVSNIEPALREFASQGYDLVIGHGFQFQEPIIKVAGEFPKVKFALGTGFKTLANTAIYDVQLEDGGYLMGTLAGLLTKTNKIGVVGGADVSEIYRGHEAYKYAAKKVNPSIQIQELYTGDWRDAAKAKEGAISMFDSGADLIWHSGDGIGLGVVDAGKEKNKLVLGNVADQNVLAPNNVLSGIVYNWNPVLKQIVDDILNNNFENREDKHYWLTVANGGVTVASFHGLDSQVSAEVKEKLEQVKKDFADKKIEMPKFDK
ncbi:BMP family protein [Desulfosporosinus nitroreducens]|uniref:BMP family protein n=1 Tax=Desulfosporosinus nitroreducens TaxID=2018668 RepID=A0ABT8QW69_9FIRM|nr:BMP family protein [Desulfosporosinus nitroreducens]MCO1600815.1 BMP family protein [Desulfosporosinus nitroreducens]MDO0825578.1 BMP family protein [Desulfosporosinus nitroreducens]